MAGLYEWKHYEKMETYDLIEIKNGGEEQVVARVYDLASLIKFVQRNPEFPAPPAEEKPE